MRLKLKVNKYKYKHRIGIAAFILPIVLLSCNAKKEARIVEPAFYYWKSVFNLSNFEKLRLDSLKVKTVYIKFFDVGWNGEEETAIPIAKLQADSFMLPQKFNIIPTIFITNECIQKIHSSQVGELSNNIYKLVDEIIKKYSIKIIKEIQIDCDWTASTKSNYFFLLENLHSLYKNSSVTVSATIRLHQIKFLTKTGVPPVNKGLLMCYNMGNLKNQATKNSVIETEELKKYVANISNYPLPLDVALPLFEWKVLFRNSIYSGLIQDLPDAVLTHSFTSKKENRFEILKDTLLQGYELKKGDILRSEQSEYSEILSAAAEINKRLKNTHPRVSLYHLDSVILSKYTLHELEAIYNSMR